jgi:uncharacterized surface protein with fasciclin (FAS1) repeats
MRTSSLRRLAVALSAAMILTACSSDTPDPEAMGDPAPAPVETPLAGNGTIIEVAAAAGDFSTLIVALEAAGLTGTLSGDGPFTVFAPTDAAFAALPPRVLETLLLPGNTRFLKSILTYHVVPGSTLAADVAIGPVITVQGETITLANEGGVTVNGAAVVTFDWVVTNGVIHVIDAVLLPPSVDLSKF